MKNSESGKTNDNSIFSERQSVKSVEIPFSKNRKGKKIALIFIATLVPIIALTAIIVVIYIITKKEDGGYIITKYNVNTNEDSITIFNPTSLDLKSEEYLIEYISDDKSKTRILEQLFNLDENKIISKMNGTITFKIKIKKVISTMSGIFRDCNNLIEIDFSNFKSKEVNNLNTAFLNCNSLTSINFKNFDSSKVETMDNTFESCEKLTSLDLSNFQTTNLKSMLYTFKDCKNIEFLNLYNFNGENLKSVNNILEECGKINYIIINDEVAKNKILNKSNFEFNDICYLNEIYFQCKNCNETNNFQIQCTNSTSSGNS